MSGACFNRSRGTWPRPSARKPSPRTPAVATARWTADTVRGYLAALRRLMVYEEQPAWSPRLRSRSLLRRAPKRHFVDPSLAVAALGATPARLLADLNFLGLLFESMVYRDLSVYSRNCDASVYHYRDNTSLEVDALVQNRRGDWCAFEVKLGAGQVDAAAASLSKLRERVDQAVAGEPRNAWRDRGFRLWLCP